jgi:5-formyltetrahydrofolate cyclo-ligase
MNKAALRKIYLEKRKALSAEECLAFSERLTANFFKQYHPKDFPVIHVYLPILSKNEPNTFLIIKGIRVLNPEAQILVPVTEPQTHILRNCLLRPDTALMTNEWGIPEPAKPIFTDLEPDLVVLPLLAYDKQGYRVGYGKGFYDRFLAGLSKNPIKVGLSFFEPVEEIEDTNEYDIAMDFCVGVENVWST